MIAWLIAAILLLIHFKVFSPASLRSAPVRRSLLSLPVLGGVILLYLLLNELAFGVAFATKFLPPPAAAGTAAVSTATSNASQPATSASPSATSAPNVPTHELAVQTIGACAELCTVAVIVLLGQRLFHQGLRGWGLHLSQIPSGIRHGFLALLCTFPILAVISYATALVIESMFHRDPEIHPTMEALFRGPPIPERLLYFVIAAIIAPIGEEIFFRGILQTTLIQPGWGFLIPQITPQLGFHDAKRPCSPPYQRWIAIVLTSIAFAGIHQLDHFVVLFVLSVAMGYIYERSGNLWASMTLHASFNAVQIIPVLLAPQAS